MSIRRRFFVSVASVLFCVTVTACSSESGDSTDSSVGALQPSPTQQPAAQTELPQCCGGRARCVPKARIDESCLGRLDDCEGSTDKCVPTELVGNPSYKGASCAGNVDLGKTKIPYKGVCLSDCLKIESENLLSRDGCATGELCIPCEHPITGVPTNAPGCPAS